MISSTLTHMVLILVLGVTTVPDGLTGEMSPSIDLAADDSQHPGGVIDSTLPKLRGMIELYSADRRNIGRFYDAPMSKLASDRTREYLQHWQEVLDAIDFDALERDQQVDHLLFQNDLRYRLRSLEHQQLKEQQIDPFVPFAETITRLQEKRRQVVPVDGKILANIITDLDRAVKDARTTIEKRLKEGGEGEQVFEISVANRASRMVDRLQRTLSGWYRFYAGYDPLFTWWVEKPYKDLEKTLKSYSKFIRNKVMAIDDEDDPPIIGDPVGREELMSMLEHEMIAYSPEQLIEIARQEFDWCRNEMVRAAQDLGYGDDWRKALEHVKELHVEPGKQPDLIRELAHEAVEFIEQRDLVTIPDLCKETWRMEMLSAARQKTSPYFLGGETIMVAFPTHEMEHEDKRMSMRGNNRHFARATVHHELIPGHHLQGFMTSRHQTHRRGFGTPFWMEGWALYWEMLLWDKEFAESAENRVGMLFWRTHRCARIIFSLSYHLGRMSAEEAIDFLVENVGHERNNATAEVRRSVSGSYGPLYQAAYMLGGLQLMALHRELVDSGQMSDREFHDRVLKNNSIPIDMVRAALSDVELKRNHRPTWNFYGAVDEGKTVPAGE
ncbi:MAG: DUF885 family protein [Planctomycetes bacterium]|jgi:uncharacterized protein (DUF885 family)|nr:DUF885 family protein [Planctomycetota bacterium]MBT6453685.1 DUF885 family protein [Planctomycetota bacterium]MBT6540674.1 DUF885 family protein [Planctomycetota bacterium]MBT6784646.1 DUF885 family protein [Planctomycetota bacterium]MBT6967373.1 DUF885 family protein [Planctomycetota bacterium]